MTAREVLMYGCIFSADDIESCLCYFQEMDTRKVRMIDET